MQYTIEARELTNEYTHRPSFDNRLRSVVIEATDADEAISQYLRDSDSELVSFTARPRTEESIATVKKEDAVYLVRVYAG